MYYTYRYALDPINANTRYTPSMNFDTKYSEVKGIVTLEDELVPETMYKVLPNGQISGKRIGRLTADYSLLSQFGMGEKEVTDIMNRVGAVYDLSIETKESLASFIRTYTSVPEITPNIFEVAPAFHDPLTDKDIPARIIDLS